MTDIYPLMGFALGCIWAIVTALIFNVRTAFRVRGVQLAASKDSQTWLFWSDIRRVRSFLLSPNSFYDLSDTTDVRDKKALLILHRASLWKYLLVGCIGLVFFPIIGVAAAFIIASPR
jgi:hypothetical protein